MTTPTVGDYDQVIAHLRDLARSAGALRVELRRQGFSARKASHLAAAWLEVVIEKSKEA